MVDLKAIMRLRDFGYKNFMELFSTEVFPILAKDFEALLKMLPTRVQKAADDKKAKKEKEGKEGRRRP